MNHPLLLVFLTAAGIYVAKLWRDDEREHRAGCPRPGALPGATGAPPRALVVAAAGGILLVLAETLTEARLGVSAEQTRLTWLAALYSVTAAPVIEEVIFRGWIVLEKRGQCMLWLGIVAASIGFALLHPFLWEWNEHGFQLTLTLKGGCSTFFAFAASLWFYTVRFFRWNPAGSLLPCFVAHSVKNAAVIAAKTAAGFMGGWW